MLEQTKSIYSCVNIPQGLFFSNVLAQIALQWDWSAWQNTRQHLLEVDLNFVRFWLPNWNLNQTLSWKVLSDVHALPPHSDRPGTGSGGKMWQSLKGDGWGVHTHHILIWGEGKNVPLWYKYLFLLWGSTSPLHCIHALYYKTGLGIHMPPVIHLINFKSCPILKY